MKPQIMEYLELLREYNAGNKFVLLQVAEIDFDLGVKALKCGDLQEAKKWWTWAVKELRGAI